MSEIILKLSNVRKVFTDEAKPLVSLEDINLEIKSGEFFVFVGPSGSGKSTLLRIMSGLEKNFNGSLSIANGLTQKDMSFIFQQFAILPWLSVIDNVAIGLTARNVPLEARHHRAMIELRRLGLEKFAHTKPHELSGGMKQRVGIARALATDPKIIFMDEAFSELDSFTAEGLRQEFLQIWAEKKPTIIMVTHIVEEALELADRIAVLSARPGRIEKIVHNTLPRPRQKRSNEFFALEDELYRLIKP